MYELSSVLVKNVIYQGIARRVTGKVRIPTQDHDYIVVTPTGAVSSEVIHLSDVISILT